MTCIKLQSMELAIYAISIIVSFIILFFAYITFLSWKMKSVALEHDEEKSFEDEAWLAIFLFGRALHQHCFAHSHSFCLSLSIYCHTRPHTRREGEVCCSLFWLLCCYFLFEAILSLCCVAFSSLSLLLLVYVYSKHPSSICGYSHEQTRIVVCKQSARTNIFSHCNVKTYIINLLYLRGIYLIYQQPCGLFYTYVLYNTHTHTPPPPIFLFVIFVGLPLLYRSCCFFFFLSLSFSPFSFSPLLSALLTKELNHLQTLKCTNGLIKSVGFLCTISKSSPRQSACSYA